MGLMGVRVSTTIPRVGFTITRDDGWFDLMINGGGAVKILFGRQPFRPQERIIQVPWNEVVILDTVTMSIEDEKGIVKHPQPCISHDYDSMKPIVLATWKHGFQGSSPDQSAILAESQVLQESIKIPGSSLNLVYHSSKATGYLSTIELQLTPEDVPIALQLIHLRISIEGILFEKTFEADPSIKFTYSWNRLNIYKQKVYGVTTAVVKVGYQYNDCQSIIWDIQTTKLSGHDVSISQIGGWNLDIHHRYNFHDGILQMGDGSNIFLRQKPRMIQTIMGDGHQRSLNCNDCEGIATKQKLLAPVALASADDGAVYVGDFNYIRKIFNDGSVKTIVKLNATRVSYRYHMAISPVDGTLYISDPESHQIIRVLRQNDFSDPERNWEVVVGSGERCLPGDEAHCGDGAQARDAKLAYPKGLAISSEGILYFADGTNIRMVDREGIISTIIGSHVHKSHWKPIPCEGTLKMEEVLLRWPTEVAINPLDGALHFLDDHIVMMMTPDSRLRIIAGRPLHCTASAYADLQLAIHNTLVMPQSIAFAPSGDLYIAESDSQRINRIRVIGTDGRMQHYSGAESKCNCLERGCDCFDSDHFLATSAKFNTISALTVSPDGTVYIADQANYRIRAVGSQLPAGTSREYEIYHPETQEIYIFNRFGQHIQTRNIMTGETQYTFSYNVNTSNGKLSIVTDAVGNRIYFLRDYTGNIQYIENSKGQKCTLKLSPRYKLLHEFRTPDNFNITYEYHGGTGLLKTKVDTTGRAFFYNYDEFGRIVSVIEPTGKIVGLNFDLSEKGASIIISESGVQRRVMSVQTNEVVEDVGESLVQISVESDGSTRSVMPCGVTTYVETSAHAIITDMDPVLGEMYPVPAKQRTELKNDVVNRFEWRYVMGSARKQATRKSRSVARKLRVNGENVLHIEYDRDAQQVHVMTGDEKVNLLKVEYDKGLRPVAFRPLVGEYAPVELEYDRYGHISTWKWGSDLHEAYKYDAGRLQEVKYSLGAAIAYAYKDPTSIYPLKITTPRQSDFLLQYDDAGALQSITTPRGHIHTFTLQTSLGYNKFQYFSPIQRHPFEIHYDDDGRVMGKYYPHQSGRVVNVYDDNGRLEMIIAGLSSSIYTYHPYTAMLKQVEVKEPGCELRREFKYHTGLLKDELLKMSCKGTMSTGHYKYHYDTNGRLSAIEMNIDGAADIPMQRFKFHPNLGQLMNVADLKITQNTYNRTVVQDASKQFISITDVDERGRVKSVLVNIKSVDVFRLELDYDPKNRIKTHKVAIGRKTSMESVTYNDDGHLLEMTGTDTWKFNYDENGNIIGMLTDESGKKVLGYDTGDRVIQINDVEVNSYDSRGFVVRRGDVKYRYNNRGQMIHLTMPNSTGRTQMWYTYDDMNRLVMWHDDVGNVTQLFYTNVLEPKLVTHMYSPKSSRTFRYIYDDRNHLLAIEVNAERFFVATDQNGSPLAFFDVNGNIVKVIERAPFGHVTSDTNPGFYVPIGFHGGIIDPINHLVFISGRMYDPTIAQWMTPDWERLAMDTMQLPQNLFTYRFNHNDPINRKAIGEDRHMANIGSWLKMLGYDITKMRAKNYLSNMHYKPPVMRITSTNVAPSFGVISGMSSIVDKVFKCNSQLDCVITFSFVLIFRLMKHLVMLRSFHVMQCEI